MPHLKFISGVPFESVISKLEEIGIEFRTFNPHNSSFYFRDSTIHIHPDHRAVYEIHPSINKDDLSALKRMGIRFDKEDHLLERTNIKRSPWFRSGN